MKICRNCNTECDDSKVYCHNCGSLLGEAKLEPSAQPEKPTLQPTRQEKSVLMPILLSVSIVVIVVLGICLAFAYSDVDDYMDLWLERNRDYYDLEDEYEALERNYDFFYDNARVVPDDGSGIYHRYECVKYSLESFWIYNKELAKTKATPCQKCCYDE